MTLCDKAHAPNALCTDPQCFWKVRNPYWRLQRRYERLLGDLTRLRKAEQMRLRRAGGANAPL